MPSSFVSYVVASPMNSLLVAFCSLLWLWMWNNRVPLDSVSISYRLVVDGRQWWRLASSHFTHLDVMHILFNMGYLISVGKAEAFFGSLWYLETSAMLLLASNGVWMGGMHVAVKYFGRAEWAESSAVGYSSVIFGWMSVLGLIVPSANVLGVPMTFAPFISLLITQCIVPRASFSGHAAGIVAGYMIGWGLFDAARGYWTLVAVCALAFACAVSLRAADRLPLICQNVIVVSPDWAATVAGGGEGGSASGGGGAVRYVENGVLRSVSRANFESASQNAAMPPFSMRNIVERVRAAPAAAAASVRAIWRARGATAAAAAAPAPPRASNTPSDATRTVAAAATAPTIDRQGRGGLGGAGASSGPSEAEDSRLLDSRHI
jgi:membrane associated rhomboid family serine protease